MKKTAIILFADLPDFEARRKSFGDFSSKKVTQKLSYLLTQHFYKIAQQTSAQTFLIDSYHQRGNSFGERISNAFKDVYAKGFDHVICIGNDCPDLGLNNLQNAITQTEAGNIVLGPTFDGGTYLIGIPKQKFNSQSFEQIRWQSKNTLTDLKVLFNNDLVELSVFSDVDKPKDFFLYEKNPLIKRLLVIINSFKTCYKIKINLQRPVFFWVDSSFLKGPPLLSF